MQDRRIHSEERRFPPDGRSVRDARMFVHHFLGSHDFVGSRAAAVDEDDELAGRVALIVSELAGNAVVHAASPYTVRIEDHDGVIRGEVRDDDRHLPFPRSTSVPRAPRASGGTTVPGAHGGRGLVIVDAMADRWGAEPDGHGGKIVWFEVDATESPIRGLPDSDAG